MQLTVVDGVAAVTFGLVPTLAPAALVLFLGSFLQRRVPLLSRSNIRGPVIRGLFFALGVFVLHTGAMLNVGIDSVLANPLQMAFFTSIGLGATLSVLRSGGRKMVVFAGIIIGTGIVQSVLGAAIAMAIGARPALGIICDSVTLLGGPATGLAFTRTFEEMGIAGAGALIIASATFVVLGRDNEAAVATTGHIGFAVGIATNAGANIQALIGRYGPTPRSVMMVPVVSLLLISLTRSSSCY